MNVKKNHTVRKLQRGGYLIETHDGLIQFGSPPETIKDTMNEKNGVPSIFVLPEKFFSWTKGISVAELEFPIYYNFFFRKLRTTIVCQKPQAERFKKVLRESVFGPDQPDFSIDYTDKNKAYDISPEISYFRTMELGDMVEFATFENNVCKIGSTEISITENKDFDIYCGGEVISQIPGTIEYEPKYLIGERLHEPFLPPLFGMTCLGPSHGFDPEENTSGFILWINHHGIMIDPPVNSTEWLLDSNVSPKFIDSIILTHCHADHDAGTFQKILEEEKVNVYTTKTIMMSFLEKYSVFTDSSKEYLMSLFNFIPVKIDDPFFIHGARFRAFYSLHSIPTIGFRAEFQNRSLTYSSDHNNTPDLHAELLEKGIISQKRYEELSSFPWDSDIIFHESGVPPLHTPVSFLASQPEEIKKKIIVYHISQKDLPSDSKLAIAKYGIENTIYLDADKPEFEKAYRTLSLFRSLDFFKQMTLNDVQDFLGNVTEKKFSRGEKIIKKGDPGDSFYIIHTGNVSIKSEDGQYKKILGTYDYFGETALLKDESRSADVTAETEVTLYSIEKDKFLQFVRGTEYEKIIFRLAENRDREAWEIFAESNFLKHVTSTQRIWLESMIESEVKPEGSTIIKHGQVINEIYILKKGSVELTGQSNKKFILYRGDIIGSVEDLFYDKPSSYTFSCHEEVSLYKIKRKNFKRFLEQNPGLIMKLQYNFI